MGVSIRRTDFIVDRRTAHQRRRINLVNLFEGRKRRGSYALDAQRIDPDQSNANQTIKCDASVD